MQIIFYLTFSLIILSTFHVNSQVKTVRVFFKDKGPEKFQPGTELHKTTVSKYTEKAKKRRSKVIGEQYFYEDAPIYQPYIDSLKSFDVDYLLSLKWRNYSVIRCDSSVINNIRKLDFVKSVQLTNSKIKKQIITDNADDTINQRKVDILIQDDSNPDISYYGNSNNQVRLMGADKLHALGIKGDSVLISIMDSGFRWKNHTAINTANVIFEYDFLQNDSTASNEETDVASQDGHGTLCFSSIAANYPGKLIGISPNSDFILFKTESIPNEILLEEDNYASAMELADELGADVTSSSLAYIKFDSTDDSYSFNELDGKTSISANALNEAVKRGIICVTAAGNTGPKDSTILTPADADSAITVGAVKIVNGFTIPARFTSRGPRADNQIKPDISALGVKVACAAPGDESPIISANGTSLATPLVAGAVSLLLSCFPELRPWEVRELIYSTSSKYPIKNNINGYGIINIWESMKKAGTIISPPSYKEISKDKIRISFNIVPQGEFTRGPKVIANRYLGNCSYFYEYQMTKGNNEYEYFCEVRKEHLSVEGIRMYLYLETDTGFRRYPSDESKFFYYK